MNGTIAAMKAAGVPITLESYRIWAYAGDPPEMLDAEELEVIPEELRAEFEAELEKQRTSR
jgi:hypothetical protein